MSVAMPETGVPAPPVSHPTVCPSWCVHRRSPMGHHFGPDATPHTGPELAVRNPAARVGDDEVLLIAELHRMDVRDETGRTVLAVRGYAEADLSRDETGLLLAQVEAFAEGLRVALRQMDAS